MPLGPGNHLLYGNNLPIMREKMGSQSVDLIYLDPPFKSDKNYNILYRTMTGLPVPDQKRAFEDAWSMDANKEKLIARMPVLLRDHGVDSYYVKFWEVWIYALRNTQPELLAYLLYMVERLLWMKTILKDTGSIYLHCDPTASHYIKVMMDGIFGHANFRSEIIWKRTSAHSGAKRYGPIHDVILFYSKTDRYTWNKSFQPYDDEYVRIFFDHKDSDGRQWTRTDLTGPGKRKGDSGHPWRGFDPTDRGRHWQPPSYFYEKYRAVTGNDLAEFDLITRLDKLDEAGLIHWPAKKDGMPRGKRYLDDAKGIPLQDVWSDIRPLHNLAVERLGYQTQKPIELLKRIIATSSNPGAVVFDPFCGCGTTIYAAQEMGRTWIGCDIAIIAINLIVRTLGGDRFRLSEGPDFSVDGIPVSLEQAQKLARKNKTHFQNWSVESIGGFPNDRISGDKGIDGRLWFETSTGLKSMILSVKGGGIKPGDIRDLRGAMDAEPECEMGGFITLKEPTRAMKSAADSAGVYTYAGNDYPKLQILSTEEILEGRRLFQTPTRVGFIKSSTGQRALPLH